MRGQFLEHFKSWQFYNVLGSHAWPISRTCQIVAHWCIITARSCTSRQMDPIERKPFLGIHFIVYVFGASMCDVFTFEHVIVLSGVSQMDRTKWKLTTFGGQTIQMCHSFRGKDWTRESEWLEKSRTNQFVKVVCHWHVNVDCVSEQPGDNVLGSQAWRISRTYQIVAHWCNSWVPVASLIDRRIRACVPVCLRIWHALVLQCSRISCVANF